MIIVCIRVHGGFKAMGLMRVNSTGNDKGEYRLNMVPVFEEGTGQPAPLCHHHTGINTLQEKLCGTTYAKGMTWHGRKTGCNPHCIAMVHEPGFRYGSPTTISCLKGKERH